MAKPCTNCVKYIRHYLSNSMILYSTLLKILILFYYFLYITMFTRNRKRKDANLLPFHIWNNFRRQQQDVTVPSNNDEIDNVIKINDNEMQEQ